MKASEIQAKMSAASTGETTNMTSSNKGGEEFDEEEESTANVAE